MELEGKCAIVTGSSRGIGKAIATVLAQAGASVIVTARTKTEPKVIPFNLRPGDRQVSGLMLGTVYDAASEIEAVGGEVLGIPCDVTKERDVEDMVGAAIGRFGKVDILVNNAAVFPRYPYLETSQDELEQVLRTNLVGYYLTSKHVLPQMIERSAGSIVNVTAGSAVGGGPRSSRLSRDLMAYAVSKAGVNRLTTYIAEEVRDHGIAVNALIPGVISTPGMDDALPNDFDYEEEGVQAYPAKPEVFAGPVLFLAVQTSETFTGHVVHNMEFGKSWP